MTTCTWRCLTGVAALTLVLLACNDVPIDTLQRSFTVKVVQSQTNKAAVKVDFLWMIDNSSSMCQEQTALYQSVGDFMDPDPKIVHAETAASEAVLLLDEGHDSLPVVDPETQRLLGILTYWDILAKVADLLEE